MFKTRITELFGIEYPIIQGVMSGLCRAELVSAVSNAGGLGTICSGSLRTIKELRDEIKITQSLTDKPFAVNITLPMTRPTSAEEAEANKARIEERIKVMIEEGVRIFDISAGNPAPYMPLFKEAKVKVIDKVGRVADAIIAEGLGVDAVTIAGFEGGGHPGIDSVASLVFIPKAVDSVKIPVIAAGGIADARGFVAALALGAEGVLMGTRFLTSRECPLTDEERERLLEAQENETELVQHGAKASVRLLRTKEGSASYVPGSTPVSRLCGQVIGLIYDIPSVKEIIDRIISEATLISQRLGNTANSG